MSCRTIVAALLFFCATLPASALTFKPADEAVVAAASRMKVKDYKGARQAGEKIADKGARAFVLGIAAAKTEEWEDAAAQLAVAVEAYPLLADYALYYQGLANSKLQRYDQAYPPLYKLLKQYPESRLIRAALILYADTLAAGNFNKEAVESYTTFLERYPSGNDSISALFGSALCREKMGDAAAGAGILRGIYLNYPASSFADKSARELQRMAAGGVKTEPYSSAELFKRAGTLYGLGRYKDAAEAYAGIPLTGESGEFVGRVKLKKGQALYKAKMYQQAQTTLAGVTDGPSADEAELWYARLLDKTGKGDEAYKLFIKLAEDPKGGSTANEALLDAAYVKRFERKWSEALPLFKRYLAACGSQKNVNVMWEAAWSAYQSRAYQEAIPLFRKLTDRDGMRDKALYWLGKTLAATGDAKGAEEAFATLASEFPMGYYALISNRLRSAQELAAPPTTLADALPVPSGFEREKALISFGMFEEAARELSASKKAKNAAGLARLYLEMDNFNGAFHALGNEGLRRCDKDNATIWGATYPLAFREDVSRSAAAHAVPETLIYAVMRTESNFFPASLSPVGAVGLMQIMPATAESMAKGGSKKLANPDVNIKLGTRHLKDLLSLYDRNLTLVAAAYNAGSGNVKRWQKTLGDLPTDEFVESIPFKETREYVKKVVSSMEIYQRLYRLPPYKHPPVQKTLSPAIPEPEAASKVAQD